MCRCHVTPLTWAMHTSEHSSVLLLGASLPDVHPWNLQQEAHCVSELQPFQAHGIYSSTSPWQKAGQNGTAECYCQSSSCTEVHGCFLLVFWRQLRVNLDLRQPILHHSKLPASLSALAEKHLCCNRSPSVGASEVKSAAPCQHESQACQLHHPSEGQAAPRKLAQVIKAAPSVAGLNVIAILSNR